MSIKFVVFDFDGVFNDGIVCINNKGIVLKKYNSKDGMGIGLLKKNNIKVGVISGYKDNDSQKEILKHLKIDYVALETKNKLEKLQEWCEELNIDMKTEVAYMGDDLNDMQVINEVNLSGCPFDAVEEIKQIVKFKSEKKGGEGCVREFCDFILNKLENKLGYFDEIKLDINYINDEDFGSGFELLDSSYSTKVNNIKNINVIILASDIQDRCLSKCKGNTFLLEQQIRLCLISGIQKKNIHVIFDSNKFSKMNQFFEDIGCNYYSLNNDINYRSCIPLIETISKINDINNFNYIIIQSNILFTVSQLEIIYNNLDSNILLSREAISTTETGIVLNVSNTNINGLINHNENKELLFPWKIYAGIMCIKYEIIKEIKNNSKINDLINLSVPEYIYQITNKLNIKLTNIDFYPSSSMDNKGNCMELKGGSYANLSKNLIVRKTASGKGYEKLEYELKFLKNNITSDIVEYFPTILNEYKDNKIIYFDMPFYNFECLQRLILLKSIKYEDVIKLLEKIFDFIFNKLYTKILGNDVDDWIMNKHIKRVLTRLEETRNYSKKYEEFIDADTITINGKKYKNIKFIIKQIMNNKTFLEKLKPDYMRLIHGDLHFENIMVFKQNNEYNFKLIDPRGELTGSDLYYDMGKLWHSFNSLYDFVRTDQFVCEYSVTNDKNIDVQLELGDKSMIKTYNKIKNGCLELFKKYDLVNKDPLFEMKSRFSEAMHLSSVYPFHLYKDTRATVLYFRSVVILNEFFEDYKDMICL